MYITSQKSSRLRKKQRMKTIFKNGTSLEGSVHSVLSRAEYERNKQDFLESDKVLDIREGNENVIIIYKPQQ